MDYSLTGSSDPFIDTSYDTPATPATVTSTLTAQGQAVTATPVNDPWTGWFQGLANNVVGYGIAKNAVQTKAALGQPTAQPGLVYAQPAQTSAISPMVLLIGAAILAVVLIKE